MKSYTTKMQEIGELPILKPIPLKDIQKKYDRVKKVTKKLSNMDRLAMFITNKVGTMGFFFIILIWTVLWLGWNMVVPAKLRFDPYPGFVLWLFISNLIQIHLMPLIMVGQNIQSKHTDQRSEYDYQTDKKAEAEIETVLLRLEENENLLKKILAKIEAQQEKA